MKKAILYFFTQTGKRNFLILGLVLFILASIKVDARAEFNLFSGDSEVQQQKELTGTRLTHF